MGRGERRRLRISRDPPFALTQSDRRRAARRSHHAMVHPHIEKVLFSEDAIDERVRDIGKRIAEDFAGKRPVVLGVLKGCFMFFSDVCKRIDPLPEGCEVQFARASSYVGKTTSTGDDVEVKLTFVGGGEDLVKDRHVIVVEDIVDTGKTMLRMLKSLERLGAKTVTVATLLDKPTGRKLPTGGLRSTNTSNFSRAWSTAPTRPLPSSASFCKSTSGTRGSSART